jgi:cellulose synthase/poly-beta-1,6-N-acetylglucosamine synthase-like glycosyltransferase
MLREGWVPLRRDGDAVMVASSAPPTAKAIAAMRTRLATEHIEVLATTDWDVQQAVRRCCRREIADSAANQLALQRPELSARDGFARWQLAALALAGVLLLILGILWPRETLAALFAALSVGFSASIIFKAVVALAGWQGLRRARGSPPERSAGERIPDDELPVYTILVPAFREANVVAGLMGHLGSLDYPREKLEILLLMEEEDTATIDAARAAGPPEMIRFVIVPPGRPQTKPRACNVGLDLARGEFLVIYDAEDRPEPDQLRESVAAFRAATPETVCLQARLNYFNARENFLSRMFTLEYSQWFDYMLPGLHRLRLSMPLGGTSNHFRTEALRRLGGWDAWNVTEDADLGVRAAALGMRVGLIESTTYEEACSQLRPWVRQRTRWIKGYMQTAIVHTRHPATTVRRTGVATLVTLLFLIAGTAVTGLVAPIVWTLSLIWALDLMLGTRALDDLPGWIGLIAMVNLAVGYGLLVLIHCLAVVRRRTYALLPWALLIPLYWALHSIAAWRALIQLATNPFYWEKTPHGLTSYAPGLHVGSGRAATTLSGG